MPSNSCTASPCSPTIHVHRFGRVMRTLRGTNVQMILSIMCGRACGASNDGFRHAMPKCFCHRGPSNSLTGNSTYNGRATDGQPVVHGCVVRSILR